MIKSVGTPLPYKVRYRIAGKIGTDERWHNERAIVAWCEAEIGQRALTAEVFRLPTHDWDLIDQGGQWFLAGTESWYFRRHADALAFVLHWK